MRDPNDFQTIDMFKDQLPGEIRFLLEVKLPKAIGICNQFHIPFDRFEAYQEVETRLIGLGYINPEEQRHAC